MKIKQGDVVIIISGKDRGKKGKVVKSYPAKDMVVVDGVNIQKKHQRPTRQNQKGQIIDKTVPVHVSNVAFLDLKTDKPTRVGYKIVEGGKVRITRKSSTIIK